MTTIEQYGEIEYTRGRDFFDPLVHANSHVTIVGCGGIGSFAAHALAKLGIASMTLVDFDIVEAHNVPNQLYVPDDIGQYKSGALATALERTTRANIVPYVGGVDEGGALDADNGPIPLGDGIVLSALDNMAARSWLWERVKRSFTTSLFLDGRLGGQLIVVYAVNPLDMEDRRGYEATLHSDEEGLDLPCTGTNVIDVGYAMASIITRHVRTHYAGGDVPKITFQNQQLLSLSTSMEWLL